MISIPVDDPVLADRIMQLLEAVREDYRRLHRLEKLPPDDLTFDVIKRRKYLAIFTTIRGNKSIHCFIDMHGYVFKPESNRNPAKGARYCLMNDESLKKCLRKATWTKSYLYSYNI